MTTHPTLTVRRARADEWRETRELRLAALLDPAAPVAFLETHEVAAAKEDVFWEHRAATAATSDAVAAYVAVDEDGCWVGAVTGLVEEPGATDVLGGPVERRQVHLVGVFVRPEFRGAGLLGRLFDGVQEWGRGQGVERARLCVHVDNPRAQAAYRKLGFAPSGVRFTLEQGEELEMVRDL
ncbi:MULTISPECIES: GNAT family N-acetyltransferase [unclassified Isoptericola]|uniref:GNAT family N-acetyltransferase n=1 Tax=unclassified Isoptericola TaxID=2623355 RepID=UPI0036648255